MILFGRYMTALMPSNGLVPIVDHVQFDGSRMRVVVSGPASRTRPSESTNMNGYSGDVSVELVRAAHVRVVGSNTSGSEFTDASENGCAAPGRACTMLSPENTRARPSASSVTVGYQRPTLIFCAAVHVPLDGS